MSKESTSKRFVSDWSEPNNGLSGRLRVEFEDLKPGLRHALYLELRNHGFDPIAVTNQPQIHAELFDSTGKPIRTSGFSANGPSPITQWAVIPRDAYLGFRIDMQTVAVPTREHGLALLAVGGNIWVLRAGEYLLKATIKFKDDKDGPPNRWVGEIRLPPVAVVVTNEMLAVN